MLPVGELAVAEAAEPAEADAEPAETAAEYYAGYLWAVKEEDKRDEIVGCFKTDSDLNDML